jgi:hypothetical protein
MLNLRQIRYMIKGAVKKVILSSLQSPDGNRDDNELELAMTFWDFLDNS